MAERDRPAVRIDVVGIVLEPEAAQAGEGLRGERLIELDDVEAQGFSFSRSASLPTAGIGPTPITRGATPAVA